MSIDLSGKTAVVTGAASGIGESVATTLAAAGASVIVTDLAAQAAQGGRVVARITDMGGSACFTHWISVTSSSGSPSRAAYGSNTQDWISWSITPGLSWWKPIEETSLDELRWISRINIEGYFPVKHSIPLLRVRAQTNPAGRPSSISSAMGIKGYPFGSLYSMTKGAIRAFSKSIALEFAQLRYNIRVNSIHPGLVDTAMVGLESEKLSALGAMGTSTRRGNAARFPEPESAGQAWKPAGTGQRRAVSPASDLSSFITGSGNDRGWGETAQ